MDTRVTSSLKSNQAESANNKFPKLRVDDVLSGFHQSHSNMHRDKPIFILLDKISSILSELNNMRVEFDLLSEDVANIILLLSDIYTHVSDEAMHYETFRNQYIVDIDLHDQKNKYLMLERKSENDFQSALSRHRIAMQNIQDDIAVLERELSQIKVVDAEVNVRDFLIYRQQMQKTDMSLKLAASTISSTSFFQYYFCIVPQSLKQACRTEELEARRTFLERANNKELQRYLTPLLESACHAKRAELQALSDAKPVRDEQYREKYIELEAKVRSDECEYYSSVNHHLMLDLLRMHFVIHKLYGVFNSDTTHRNMANVFAKLHEAFKLWSVRFYCEEPGRYYFSYYLQNMRAIKNNDILKMVMAGTGTTEQIRLIIPQYQEVRAVVSPHPQ
jgi:hypothetical protein